MNNAFWPEFHQVAMYVPWALHDHAVAMFQLMGYEDWVRDEADLYGHIQDGDDLKASAVHARMSFNYELLGGKELEIVSYTGGSYHHLAGRGDDMFLSHMSVHVDDAEASARLWATELGVMVAHSFDTHNHENLALIESGKRFRERILDTRTICGFDIKFIERLI